MLYFLSLLAESEFTPIDVLSIAFSSVSVIVSGVVAFYNIRKSMKLDRKEEFSNVFKNYNKRYQEYFDKMRDKYELKEKNEYIITLDEPVDFYSVDVIKVKIDDNDPVKKNISYNKNKFPNKKEDFLSNYLSFYYEGKLRNEDSYFLTATDIIQNRRSFSFLVKGYNEYINSGTYLEYEISNSHGNPYNRIDLKDFHNRYVGVGVCTITIINNVFEEETGKKISYFLVHQRNNFLAEHPGQISIVPAGTLEPIVKGNVKAIENLNIANTIYREFGEEILGLEEFTSLADPELLNEGIIGKIMNEASKTKYLGTGIDIMNGKCEIMSMLIIDADKMGSDYKNSTIYDFLNKMKISPNSEGVVNHKKLTKTNLVQYAYNVMCTPVTRQIFQILLNNYDNKDLFN